jgi:16S rRNA (guanine527-N7)-methyltransferase
VAARLKHSEIDVDEAEAAKLAGYLNLLEEWNRVHNLTGTRGRLELIDRHLVESLALAPFVRGPLAADVGSGGGLPGIPLAIMLPEVSFTLIESRRKRASFLRHVASTLALANIDVAHARAEDVERSDFSTVLARAVAPPAELLALTEPLLAGNGRLVFLTGSAKESETRGLAKRFVELPVGNAAAHLKSRVIVLERNLVS